MTNFKLPNWKSLQMTISNLMIMAESYPNRVENTVGKGEIARYKQFLLFPQCFQKTCTVDMWKPGLVWERVKPITVEFVLIANASKWTKMWRTSLRMFWRIFSVRMFLGIFNGYEPKISNQGGQLLQSWAWSISSWRVMLIIVTKCILLSPPIIEPSSFLSLWCINPLPLKAGNFDDPGKEAFWKYCGKRRNSTFSPHIIFLTINEKWNLLRHNKIVICKCFRV